MAELSPAPLPPTSGPLLGFLVAGFALLATGIAALSFRRREGEPLISAATTRRALLWCAVYGACSACFARVLQPLLLGDARSPWLLALGDVMAVTLALFVWVMVLAEDLRFADLGLRGDRASRLVFFTLVAIAPLGLYLAVPFTELASGRVHVNADSLVFAGVYAVLGSALPEELLCRGFLMGALGTRVKQWARIAAPALVFTAIRSIRFVPGPDLTFAAWLLYVFGMVLPLGVWWGLVRDLSGGLLWPSLVSHVALQFVFALASASGPR